MGKFAKIKTATVDALFILVGCALYAAGFTIFIQPCHLTPGGLTGIAAIINYMNAYIPIGLTVIVLNIPIVIAGLRQFGNEFIIKTLAGIFASGILTDIFQKYLPKYNGNDIMLSCIAGGVMMGAGLAAVFLRGATTGGVDVLAKIIAKRKPHISIGRVMLLLDAVVLTMAYLAYGKLDSVLYSIVSMFVQTRIVDTLVYGADSGKSVHIITANADAVCNAIMNSLARGVTRIPVKGGFTGEDKTMVMCAVRRHEIAALLSAVKESDADAFITVSDVGEILGRGFRRM